MKLKILDKSKIEKGTIDMPIQFSELIRPELIQRAVLAIQSHKRQPYGANPDAGLRQSTTLSKRRRDFKATYGLGISRTPRKILSRSGTRFNWEGAFAPNTVGGRRAHPPKADKIWDQKINKKERRKAIRSAMACTLVAEIVKARGHIISKDYPFVLESGIQELAKTKDVQAALKSLGLKEELERSAKKKIRAGKGKARGRKYRKKTGPLIVVSDDCALLKSGRNIPGVNVEIVSKINCELLAPGCVPGRLTLWTTAALERIKNENLFMDKKRLIPLKQKKKKAVQEDEAKKSIKKQKKAAVKTKKTAKKK